MSLKGTNLSSFSHFPRLPPELRLQIWHYLLPDKDGVALSPYRRWCWQPRRLSKSDERYSVDDEDNLEVIFRHDLINIEVKVPLFFVNREARSIALAWTRKQGIKLQFCEDRQCPVFVRPFDPLYDVLYIAQDKIQDFCLEPWDRLEQPDSIGKTAWFSLYLANMAIPEGVVWEKGSELSDVFSLYSCPQTLYIIADEPPDLKADGMKVQHRWELDKTQGRPFIWNHEKGSLLLEECEGEGIRSEDLYSRLKEDSKALETWLSENSVHTFEMRPVFAIKG